MEWTELLKELAFAVEAHNRSLVPVRNASARVTDLIAQTATAGAPGAALTRVLTRLDPLGGAVAPTRCRSCSKPVVPPVRPAPRPQQTVPTARTVQPADASDLLDRLPRYSLKEAWERGILPWKPATVRKYFTRSTKCGIGAPIGLQEDNVRRFTEEELRTWLADWAAKAGHLSASRSTVSQSSTKSQPYTPEGPVTAIARPPLGEPRYEGDDDPDYNPVCNCPTAPRAWCDECGDCAACGECNHRLGHP